MTRLAAIPTHPVGYMEVTVALAMLLPDGSFLHREMADTTIAFTIPTSPPPRPLTEAETRETIRGNMGRLLGAIQSLLILNGARSQGQVEDPMTAHGREVGRATTDPVRVSVQFVEEGRA